MRRGWYWHGALLLLIAPLPRSGAEEPAVWLTVRAIRPDDQADRLIALFRGARAAHPAAALAAWKRATGGRQSLGKPLEAAIAALNPEMAGELRAFDQAELRLTVDPATGQARWQALAPHDDGSLAALTTALALTDGATLEPIGGARVLRLGPPGSAVAVSRPGFLAAATRRDDLASLLDPKAPPVFAFPTPPAPDGKASGVSVVLDPSRVRRLRSLEARRASAALESLRCRVVEGWIELEGETARLQVVGRLDAPPPGPAPLVPVWFDAVPARGVLAVAAVALGPGGGGLDTAFALADRVEKADPAREKLAPLRVRLDLLAAAAGVRPGRDVWPHLRGLTGAVLVDEQGHPRGGLVGLHAGDAETAARIARDVLPRLAITYLKADRAEVAGAPTRRLGSVGGRPISALVLGPSVWIGWGDRVLDDAREAAAHPDRSAGPLLHSFWGPDIPQRAGAFWPGRWARVAPNGSALAQALAEAPPVVWVGGSHGSNLVDTVRWGDLRGVVRRGLDALPLDPPPDRSNPPPRPAGETPR